MGTRRAQFGTPIAGVPRARGSPTPIGFSLWPRHPTRGLLLRGGDDRTIALRGLPTGTVQNEVIGHEGFVTNWPFPRMDDRCSPATSPERSRCRACQRVGFYSISPTDTEDRADRILAVGTLPGVLSAFTAHSSVYDLQKLKAGD